MLEHQIGKSIEVYFDYMLVNSLRVEDHLTHLQETFDILRNYNMKLNPEKCAFEVGWGKFLGFMVSNRAIKIDSDKIKATEEITVVNNVKVVQRLTGRIAALGRYISRSSDKSHHFFSLLKKKNSFKWTLECQRALEELKRYLTSPSLLHTPKEDETMYLYLAVSKIAVSAFVADFTPDLVPEVEKELLLKMGTSSGIWTLFTDVTSNVKGSGLSIVLKPPTGGMIRESIKTTRLTNNNVKYQAMVVGMEFAKGLPTEVIEVKCDSFLVVNQVNGSFEVREDRIQRYLHKIQVTLHRFKEYTLVHIPQDQNSEVDALVNLGSSIEEDDILPGAVVQLSKSVIEEGHAEIDSTRLTWDWRNKYIDYLESGKLPADAKESRALRTKEARFSLDENGNLYRKNLDGPLAVCLGPGDTDYVI
uniref:Uncharacterized protein LOC104232340 n=1 Tax=Nicotiana sylvestris TaxID=4096 RepID=A0A1U7XA52_NICSY|nr:PREDICTED: uncharacterized protein LOC104232340 [Nicotiana sylvestris]